VNADAYREALDSAYELASAGRRGEAFRLVNDLLRDGPPSPELLVLRAQLIQLLTGDECERNPDATLESAEESLRTACAVAPDSARPLMELGYFEYAVIERSDDALEHFAAAERILEQDLRECLVGAARAYFDLGRPDEAWEVVARLRVFFPDFDASEILGQPGGDE
jgi:tetratricopeptide (TPR) repeat protein